MIFTLSRLLSAAAVALALALYPAPASAPVTAPEASLKRPGCPTLHTRKDFRQAAGQALRVPPYTRREKRRLKRLARCQHNPAGRPRLRRWFTAKKRAYRARFYWDLQWQRTPWADKRWAVSTSSCESGRNPRTNTGNGYYGAFQFLPRTAWAAGFRVLPHLTSLHEQDVRAIRWRNIAGRGQWPVCG